MMLYILMQISQFCSNLWLQYQNLWFISIYQQSKHLQWSFLHAAGSGTCSWSMCRTQSRVTGNQMLKIWCSCLQFLLDQIQEAQHLPAMLQVNSSQIWDQVHSHPDAVGREHQRIHCLPQSFDFSNQLPFLEIGNSLSAVALYCRWQMVCPSLHSTYFEAGKGFMVDWKF